MGLDNNLYEIFPNTKAISASSKRITSQGLPVSAVPSVVPFPPLPQTHTHARTNTVTLDRLAIIVFQTTKLLFLIVLPHLYFCFYIFHCISHKITF